MNRLKNIFKLFLISWSVLLAFNAHAYDPIGVVQESIEYIYDYDAQLNILSHEIASTRIYDRAINLSSQGLFYSKTSYQLTWSILCLPNVYADKIIFVFTQILVAPKKRTFDGRRDTSASSDKAAFRNAKEQNGIPRSQQPDKTYTVPEKGTNKPLKQYDFTNSKGDKVQIRRDNAKKYGRADGKGDQGDHYNAGPAGGKLKQHHNID